MRRVIPLTLLFFTIIIMTSNAQELCEDSETYILDLNTINKCINKKETKDPNSLRNNRSISSNARGTNRFLTVRKKKVASRLSESMSSKGIADTKTHTQNSSDLVSLIALEKDYSRKVHDFVNVDKIPVFNRCRYSKTEKEQMQCFNENMMTFINDNIEFSDEMLEEGVVGEVTIKFVIDTNGDTYNIQVSGSKKAKALKEAIIDMISRLPKFKPGMKNQIDVPVSYEFSLNFS